MVNRNFCRPIDGGTNYAFAPVVIPPNPHEPTEAEYNAAGFYRNGIEPPSPPEGKIVSATSYVIADGKCVAIYTYADAPAAPRTFSKLKLYAALARAGLWDALKSWLEVQTVEGVNAYTAFTLAQDLSEGNAMFGAWFSAAKTALGVTDEQAEEILAQCVAEVAP